MRSAQAAAAPRDGCPNNAWDENRIRGHNGNNNNNKYLIIIVDNWLACVKQVSAQHRLPCTPAQYYTDVDINLSSACIGV